MTGEPMFVAVPPKPQRLLHSEAYIKYIEGLHSQTRYITNWGKAVHASADNRKGVADVGRLPSHWLQFPTSDKPESMASALWTLRDYMMANVLNFAKLPQ